MNQFFPNLEEALNGVQPSNLINYEQTNFCDDLGQSKIIVKRGSKHPVKILDRSKTSISVMVAAAAGGPVPHRVQKHTSL